MRLSAQDVLAVRASKKLRGDELLLTGFAASRLRMELDRVPLWRGDHVPIMQLVEDFDRYLYLPRLADSAVLVGAIRDGFAMLTWEQDSFAFADSYDESAGRYRGLRADGAATISDAQSSGLLVKPSVARVQLDAQAAAAAPPPEVTGGGAGKEACGGTGTSTGPTHGETPDAPPAAAKAKRFHGTTRLDSTRVGRDASRIADELNSHLVGLVGVDETVTIEIEALFLGGAPDNVVRTVTENSWTLKFTSQGFEVEWTRSRFGAPAPFHGVDVKLAELICRTGPPERSVQEGGRRGEPL